MDGIEDTVEILFGPGGRITYSTYGRHGRPPRTFDLTSIADALASLGIRVPRSTCPPSEVTGAISCDLGQGGRALWITGGGDVTDTELIWAIASGLEHSIASGFEELLRSQRTRVAEQLNAYVDELLAAAGMPRRQRTAFTTRTRRSLGGKSIRDIITTYHDDLTVVQSAFELVVSRARTEMDTDMLLAWLEAHSFTTS